MPILKKNQSAVSSCLILSAKTRSAATYVLVSVQREGVPNIMDTSEWCLFNMLCALKAFLQHLIFPSEQTAKKQTNTGPTCKTVSEKVD